MPSYDYRCLASGKVHEVKHSMSVKAHTWAELCALGQLEPGDIPPDSPVERLVSAAGIVGAKSSSRAFEPPCGNPSMGCGGGACGHAH